MATPSSNPHPPQPHAAMSGETTATVSNDATQIDAVQNAVVEAMDRCGYSKASKFAVRLALAEAIANAFHHGHRAMPPALPVFVTFGVTPTEVAISVEDQGPGFDPDAVPDPTLDENLEAPSGRGLMLIRAYMTRVRYNSKGNRVEMVFVKPQS